MLGGSGQEPPDVTCPDPELDDGGAALLKPLELLEDCEPDELPAPADVADLPAEPLTACCAAAACAEPGSMTLIPAAATALATPAAAVTARSLDTFRSLAATAASRARLAGWWPAVTGDMLGSSFSRSVLPALAPFLCGGSEQAGRPRRGVSPKAVDEPVDSPVETNPCIGDKQRMSCGWPNNLDEVSESPCAASRVESRNLSPLKTGSAPKGKPSGTPEGLGDWRGRRDADTGGGQAANGCRGIG
jgi:hypothetical protein